MQAYPVTATAGYPGTVNYSVAADPMARDATVTDKAGWVCSKARELRDILGALEGRLWPSPAVPAVEAKEPDPAALPWVLEAADAALDSALARAREINRKL